jgi:hypothetical protein
LVLALAGCKTVYDAQLDDRATELEKFRTVFLSGNKQVSFLSGTDNRVYWIAPDPQTQVVQLHSQAAGAAEVVYTFPFNAPSPESPVTFALGDSLVVECEGIAFDATMPDRQIDMQTTNAFENCALAGSNLFWFAGTTLMEWHPGGGVPGQNHDFAADFGPDNSPQGFAAIDTHRLVAAVGGRLFLIDVGAGTATWINQGNDANGATIAADTDHVVFLSNGVAMYEAFADMQVHSLTAAIADGGYVLNSMHDDLQTFDTESPDFTVAQGQVFYRSLHGIFAYSFDTGKVIDILLDRTINDFTIKPIYHTPTPVGNTLYVQDTSIDGDETHPVYAVDLSGRLQ